MNLTQERRFPCPREKNFNVVSCPIVRKHWYSEQALAQITNRYKHTIDWLLNYAYKLFIHFLVLSNLKEYPSTLADH